MKAIVVLLFTLTPSIAMCSICDNFEQIACDRYPSHYSMDECRSIDQQDSISMRKAGHAALSLGRWYSFTLADSESKKRKAKRDLEVPLLKTSAYWYCRAFEAGNNEAGRTLAGLISNPEFPYHDKKREKDIYLTLEERGDGGASIELARIHEKNKNYDQMLVHLEKAWESDSRYARAEAATNFRYAYSLGRGVIPNMVKALAWKYVSCKLHNRECKLYTTDFKRMSTEMRYEAQTMAEALLNE